MMLPLVVVDLHIKAVCQSVREATTASGVDNAASPRLADTAERDYFTLRERLITMQSNWKEPRSILMSSADRCPYRWATQPDVNSSTRSFQRKYKCPEMSRNRTIHLRMFAGFLFLTTFSAPPRKVAAASTVFFCPIPRNEEMMGDGFLPDYCCRFCFEQ